LLRKRKVTEETAYTIVKALIKQWILSKDRNKEEILARRIVEYFREADIG